MKIIGMGCGPGMLTEQAIKELKKARFAYGSERAIALAREYLPRSCTVRSIDDYKKLHTLPENSVILSTGDPMLAGLGYLRGEVISGISSLQVAAARLHIPLSQVIVVVAHGGGYEHAICQTLDELQRGKVVFLLSDPKFSVADLYNRTAALGLSLQVALLENLGYPDERITVGAITAPPLPQAPLYSLMIGKF